VELAVVGCVLPGARQKGFLATLLAAEVTVPVLLMLLVACAYLGLVYGVRIDREPEWHHVNERFTFYLAPDNVIPLYFAQGLHQGKIPRPIVADWLSSDRPPLQAGLVAAQYPVWHWLKQPSDLSYEVLATLLQASWVPAVWALGRGVGLGYRRVAIAFAFLIVNGFFYLNSIYPVRAPARTRTGDADGSQPGGRGGFPGAAGAWRRVFHAAALGWLAPCASPVPRLGKVGGGAGDCRRPADALVGLPELLRTTRQSTAQMASRRRGSDR
jgi:hypothetical protein